MRGSAFLVGPGWGRFRGGWCSARRLVAGPLGWRLLHQDREEARFATLDEAGAALANRLLVGWVGYEALAAHGGLPAHVPEGLAGWWLVDPEPAPTEKPAHGFATGKPQVSLDDAAYQEEVRRVLRRIAAGEVYQVNLTRRWSVAWTGGVLPLLEAVRNDPPPYLAWTEGDGHQLVSASMELLLLRSGKRVETRPIKGTRRRTGDPRADRIAAARLDADPKERAELAMVVDLVRNDLGRIARVGSVRVADPGSVSGFATVLHRIATVTAEVETRLPWWELLRAIGPSGSVTGAPKHAAMETIRQLEPVPRGPYTGAAGVVEPSGDLIFSLPIRTAWIYRGRLDFGAGCGIVWGSDPSGEERESRLKVVRWLPLLEAKGAVGMARR